MRRSALALVLFTLLQGSSHIANAMRGDFDSDGRLTARDAEAALQMSAGSRPQLPLLDMDGDGRVMSSDARIILQSIERVAAARLTATAAPLATPPRAVTPAAAESGPFYVAFAIYLPENIEGLSKRQPGKMDRQTIQKLQQELASLDIARLQFKADKTPLLVHVHGAGLKVYSPSLFLPGERFAMRVAVDYKGVTREPMKGALLLETIAVFQSQSELLARYPDARLDGASAASGKGEEPMVLNADGADGGFHHTSKSGDTTFSLRTERLEKGWSEEMKRQNVQLLIAALELCASQTALIGDPHAAEKLAALRHFRDQTLAQTETGRELIRLYYEHFSPWAKNVMHWSEATRPLFRTALSFVIVLTSPQEPIAHESKI